MEFFSKETNFDFMGWRRVAVGVSIFLMIASLALLATRGLNYALDFTGGTLVEVEFAEPVAVADVRSALGAAGFEDAMVQSLGGAREVAIRIPPEGTANNKDELGARVRAALATKFPGVDVKPSDFVGPQVGAELRTQGLVAAIFVIIGIVVYIGLRFEWRFAVASIAAEIHDTLLTLGFLALTQRDFDLTALAAVLSVIGYSINDKVVVFDRVREIFRGARKLDPEGVINKAVNSTLSRTIMTGLTTSLAVGSLYLFGGPAVEGFGIIMIVG
ncbi:MAG: protein translocase subunit SecF, partial [Lysobacterales bacterium]